MTVLAAIVTSQEKRRQDAGLRGASGETEAGGLILSESRTSNLIFQCQASTPPAQSHCKNEFAVIRLECIVLDIFLFDASAHVRLSIKNTHSISDLHSCPAMKFLKTGQNDHPELPTAHECCMIDEDNHI
jgi:hypothetical protein